MKKIVEVIDFPVRFDGKRYFQGEEFEIEKEYVNEKLMKVTGEVEVAPKTIDEMTVSELKEYAVENNINLGEAKKKDEILEAIQEFQDKTPEE